MATLSEIITPRTRAEIEASIYANLAAEGLDPATWKPGAVVRAIITGFAVVLAALDALNAAIVKSGFTNLAKGDWLTVNARQVYGVERELGSFATGTVTLVNGGGGVYAGEPGDLRFTTSDGRTYQNTEPFSLAALQTISVAIRADVLGTAGNALAGEIDDFVTPLNGVTVTNPGALIGADPEEDDDLRFRCREKTGSLSPNGPRDAYAYAARSAKRADGSSIGVTRAKVIADGNGHIDLYVATPSGAVTGTVGDEETDLGIIDAVIQSDVVPFGVTAATHSATDHAIAVTYELWLHETEEIAALTDSQIEDAANAAINAYLGEVPIGGERISGESTGRVYLSGLAAPLAAVYDVPVRVSITSPATDVDIAATEAPKGSVHTGTIHRVAVS